MILFMGQVEQKTRRVCLATSRKMGTGPMAAESETDFAPVLCLAPISSEPRESQEMLGKAV